LRSKLCMQASASYAGIVEEAKEWVTKGVFLKEWSLLIQVRFSCPLSFLLFAPSDWRN
jgi:tyrosine-protein phosphatase non-receptor type 23